MRPLLHHKDRMRRYATEMAAHDDTNDSEDPDTTLPPLRYPQTGSRKRTKAARRKRDRREGTTALALSLGEPTRSKLSEATLPSLSL